MRQLNDKLFSAQSRKGVNCVCLAYISYYFFYLESGQGIENKAVWFLRFSPSIYLLENQRSEKQLARVIQQTVCIFKNIIHTVFIRTISVFSDQVRHPLTYNRIFIS